MRAQRSPGLSSVGGGSERRCQFFHPISHRTPHYRTGKDSVCLLVAIKKRLNFQTQRDRKIQGKIDGNSLGNRCSIRLTHRFAHDNCSIIASRDPAVNRCDLLPRAKFAICCPRCCPNNFFPLGANRFSDLSGSTVSRIVHHNKIDSPMSALGHKRTLRRVRVNVRFTPKSGHC